MKIYQELEKEMATHSSILAWKISWIEEPGGLQSMGLQKKKKKKIYIYIYQENENLSWEKIFAQHVSDKGLLSKIYREFLKLNSKKMSNLILK